MQDLPEYKALEDEEGRRTAFAKYIKRQKVTNSILTPFSHMLRVCRRN